MRKNNIEKQFRIFGTMIMLASLSLLILDIYFVYCYGSFQGSFDVYYLLFGPLLLIAGLGLYKIRSWARKMMLYIMAVYLVAGIYELFCIIGIMLPPKIDNINTDYHFLIYAISVIVIAFVIFVVLPVVGVFCFLNKNEIKDFFRSKKILTTQSSE